MHMLLAVSEASGGDCTVLWAVLLTLCQQCCPCAVCSTGAP